MTAWQDHSEVVDWQISPLHDMAAREIGLDLSEGLSVESFCDWYEAVTRIAERVADTKARLRVQFDRAQTHRAKMGAKQRHKGGRPAVYGEVPDELLMDPALTSIEVGRRTGVSHSVIRRRRKLRGYVGNQRSGMKMRRFT